MMIQGGRVCGGVAGGGGAVPLPAPPGGGVIGGPVVQPAPPGAGVIGGPVVGGGVVGGGGAVGGGRVVGGGGVIKGPNGGGAGACGVDCGPGCGVSCGDGCGGGYDETGVLSFVGCGNGDYQAQTIYTYVGQGAGDVEMVMVPTKIGSNWCYCLIIIPLILLLLWLLMPILSSDTTTTTIEIIMTTPVLNDETTPAPPPPTTTAPPAPTKSCSIYGDPHAMTFDGLHSDYYTSGEFWIVKSATVIVQGKYSPTHATNGLAVTKQVAVGGSFLKGHHLIVGEEHATWDGQQILTTFPSQFRDAEGLVSIVYNNVGQLLQPGREGKSLHVLHVTLPGGVTMQINRWNEAGEGRYINTKITMSAQPGQDGQCGNFNGNPADDARLLVKARLGMNGVPAEDLMFPGPKTPINQELENCPDSTLVGAHEACKAITTSYWPSMHCLVGVCNGGEPVAPM